MVAFEDTVSGVNTGSESFSAVLSSTVLSSGESDEFCPHIISSGLACLSSSFSHIILSVSAAPHASSIFSSSILFILVHIPLHTHNSKRTYVQYNYYILYLIIMQLLNIFKYCVITSQSVQIDRNKIRLVVHPYLKRVYSKPRTDYQPAFAAFIHSFIVFGKELYHR